jgi:predicted Zn-dependent protease with MMP-like domain
VEAADESATGSVNLSPSARRDLGIGDGPRGRSNGSRASGRSERQLPYYAAGVEAGVPDPADRLFERYVEEALDALPPDLRARLSNVEIVIDDEPPSGQPLLGLYQGVPLTRRSSYYGGVLPDKITLYRGPLIRLSGHDSETLREQVRRVVFHEIAHHFGISDARLIEIDRY